MSKILVVEDHAETRDIVTIFLEQTGYDVLIANDGYEGIIMAAAERPDLIIADINLPILNGLEMIRILRARPEYRSTPILAITALGSEHTEEAIKAGANRVMIKPLEPDIFLVYIRQLLNRKQSEDSQGQSDNSTTVG